MRARWLNPAERKAGRTVRGKLLHEIPEEPRRDLSFDRLIAVHQNRLRRLERERLDARSAWRDARTQLRRRKEHWRNAVDDAKRYWHDARAGFLKMVITSGQFRQAKAVYERLKLEAAEMRLEAVEMVPRCRQAEQAFFDLCRRLAHERLHVEKLRIASDELMC